MRTTLPKTANAFGSAAASTYYVSNSGNDPADCTQTSPWKTMLKVQSCLGSLQAGDSVLFERGGIWYESLNLSNNGNGLNGSPGLPITFGNYGSGNLPIIDGDGTREFCIQGRSAKLSYITIDGFECRNTISWGIAFTNVSLESAGITVQNSYIHDTGNGDFGYHNQLEYTDFLFWTGAAGTKFLNNKVSFQQPVL